MTHKTLLLTLLAACTLAPQAAKASTPPDNGPARNATTKAAATLPYYETFDTEDALTGYLIVDNNRDGNTWKWYKDSDNPYVRCYEDRNTDADDWLLTPTFLLKPGYTYILDFDYRTGYYSECISVGIGTTETPSTYTLLDTDLSLDDDGHYQKEFTVSRIGFYRIGIHSKKSGSKFYVGVDNVSLKQGASTSSPDVVTNLTATPGPLGAEYATISFNAPTLHIDGTEISSIDKIEVWRNDTLQKTFNMPSPGQSLSCRIDGGPLGLNRYKVVTTANGKAGKEATATAWLGIDVPLPPTGVRLIDNGQTYTATWEAVGTLGAHGGYVDPDLVTYSVYNVAEELIEEGITDLSFYNDDATPMKVTGVTNYYVTASTPAGESSMAASNYLCTGQPVTLPWSESFAKGELSKGNLWWYQFDAQRNWKTSSLLSFDHDGGCVGYAGEPGNDAWLNTGKITLRGEPNPYLSFAYYATPGSANKVEIIASRMQNDDTVIATIDQASLTGNEGWRKMYLPMKSFTDCEFIILKLHAIINDADHFVALDKLQLKDRKDQDLAASMIAPTDSHANEAVSPQVTVTNEGSLATNAATVELYCDDLLVATANVPSLAPMDDINLALTFTPNVALAGKHGIYAQVKYDADMDRSNNKTATDSLLVHVNTYLPAATLGGTANESLVSLNWSSEGLPTELTDDFESYAAWSTSYLGSWTLTDGDGAYTYGFNGLEFPHMFEPMAFIVFNPEAAGLDLSENAIVAPLSGSQFIACMASDTDYATHNDDWLISPALSGEAQTVTFSAKSLFGDDGAGGDLHESFEVVALSGNDVATATKQVVLSANVVPTDWTLYQASLPEGTAHFAIHCTSADKFMLMVDDVTFRPAPLALQGYRVYRDGEVIATLPASTTHFEDLAPKGEHKYGVSVLYAEGESALSNLYSVATAITEVETSTLVARGGQGCLRLSGCNGSLIEVTGTDGRTLYSGRATGALRLAAPAGVYVVRSGKQSLKVGVR